MKGTTKIFKNDFDFVDSNTCLSGLVEIFFEQCYLFHSENSMPLIIDCGANIGISVLYFKHLYPDAKIIAFEADPNIYNILDKNIKASGLQGVDLINKAVYDSDDILSFRVEGGFSGRVAIGKENGIIEKVQGLRLKNYLNQKVDFLKLDIEGAECNVIKDCESNLLNVERVFIEYHSHHEEPQKLSEILKILTSAGFRYYIKEAYVPKAPFVWRPTLDSMDLQLNIYAMRPQVAS